MDLSGKKWNPWLAAAFSVAVFYALFVLLFVLYPPLQGSTVSRFTSGFQGGLIGGLLCNGLFLLIASSLNWTVQKRIDEIHLTVERKRERDDVQAKIGYFEEFLTHEGYHDIRLPDLKFGNQTLGLEYTVEPALDNDGKPRTKVTEMEKFYVIKVRGPANEAVLEEDALLDYENSPIRDGHFYFCRFFNGDWHMARSTAGNRWHRFYLSGKLGPVEYGESANELMGLSETPSGYTSICKFLVRSDGREPQEGGGCFQWELLRDQGGSPWIRSTCAPSVAVYDMEEKGQPGSTGTVTFIDGMRGFFAGQALEDFKLVVKENCRKHDVPIPRRRWYHQDQS